ncbi:MAG: hypothetical protein IJH07_10820 [Ruminococcus sp.]|nr:hypothetical protein [Ruminococcus sp.]
MALSTIDRVREAEKKANERQAAAEAEAEQIVGDAQQHALELIDTAKKKAEDLDSRAAAEAQSRCDEMIRDRRAKAEENAATLTEKTVKLKQNVINKLIEETLC